MGHRHNSAEGTEGILNEDIKFSLTDVDSDDLMRIGLSNALMDDGYISSPADFEMVFSCRLYTMLRDNNTGTAYKVYSSVDDMEEDAHETLKSWVEDDPIEYMSFDSALSYFDRDVLADEMRNYATDYVYGLGDDELIDELESYRIIDEDDKIPDPDWERDPDDPDEEPDMIYPPQLIEDSKTKLVDRIIGEWYDPVEWFVDTYGGSSLREFADDHPEYFYVDSYIEDELSNEESVYYLASFNGNVIEFSFTDTDGSEVHAYAAQEE